ncbi:putative exonuclease SbcCD C subunit [Nocardiopsis sp. Huas11]|uniref:SbcC/MukB-like Walker B domain-containing protein n=1 Tax=Nocardiopsis sp. Huas11 TaxID=2183912 RepID=UPI000EB40320|nr:SbcC/MukB-like Walker B domain-containing protein [Nocardiopsis sp. Huas11]RKS07485.1 putative exonuclease SbcCD C subunit [Nocardiopsis sp. Huas11]
MVTQETSEAPGEAPAVPAGTPTPRYRLERAGIRNVWQYDDHVLDFAEGRLLLRGRNGAGKSKALEMLLPFLLDGDVRRLDTTGTNRTSLRWLMAEDQRAHRLPDLDDTGPDLLGGPEEDPADPAADEAGTGDGEDAAPLTRLGYLWVEFTTDRGERGLDAAARTATGPSTASALLAASSAARGSGAARAADPADDADPDEAGAAADTRPAAPPRHMTLGAAVMAVGDSDPRCVFFITERRIGHDLQLVTDGRPMPVDRLRAEVGADNCFTSAVPYRARVMQSLFGIDDSVRYRNLIHLLYRLRRPTIGDRLEAGELVSVLSEALPPMDESVLDEVGRNIADLEQARADQAALAEAGAGVESFLGDYHAYLVHALRARAAEVREQLDACARRTAETDRLSAELDALITAESQVAEERDQARRTRDTAGADENTLAAAQAGAATATDNERRAYDAAVGAYIRAAEAAWAAAEHAERAENQAVQRMAEDTDAIERALEILRQTHADADRAAAAAGISPESLGVVPDPSATVHAPRESTTRVDLQGLEQAVEREPVEGIDLDALRERLGRLHDHLTSAAGHAADRADQAARLTALTTAEAATDRRLVALTSEAESADAVLDHAHGREQDAIAALRGASADYADGVRAWTARLRDSSHAHALGEAIHELEGSVELPITDALRVLDPEVPATVARLAHAAVDPLLEELRSRRDVAVNEEGQLSDELAELADRRAKNADHAPERPAWATYPRPEGDGVPLYLAVDFAGGLSTREQAGLEAALEASGLLAGWVRADGTLYDPSTRDLMVTPARPAKGRTLLDVLVPVAVPERGVQADNVSTLLSSIALHSDTPGTAEDTEAKHRRDSAVTTVSSMSLTGGWRLGVASGAHYKSEPEYIGEVARKRARDRRSANTDRRMAIAEALLAEAGERRWAVERSYADLLEVSRDLPDSTPLIQAWAALDVARADVAAARRAHDVARTAAEEAREELLRLRARLRDAASRPAAAAPAGAHEPPGEARPPRPPADHQPLPTARADLDSTLRALDHLRVLVASALRDLDVLAWELAAHERHVAAWRRIRADRVLAEDARAAAIDDMITVRRQIELGDRARGVPDEQIDAAREQVKARAEEAARRLPELERGAQRARDERVSAEVRLDVATQERAEQVRRALAAGDVVVASLSVPATGQGAVEGSPVDQEAPSAVDAGGEPVEEGAGAQAVSAADGPAVSRTAPDAVLLGAAGLADCAAADGPLAAYLAARTTAAGESPAAGPDARLALLEDLVARLEEGLEAQADLPEVDDSAILGSREELHRLLTSADWAQTRTELTEPRGLKRLTVHDEDGAHDVTAYAARVAAAIARADETVAIAEEEAFERHLLGELAGHLSRQIDEAHDLIHTMNDVLKDVTTSAGLGVRLDWRLAPDAGADIEAVVPLLATPPEERTRVQTTRLRDALRRCIEAIRRLDPTATGGAQLRAALDYRSWFTFTVYVTDGTGDERRLGHRTALSQGEQRVVAYLVLFAAAAAQFDALAARAPWAPRLILLDDAFAKVDEPTHGRLLGLLVELDLDFVLTSERVWGCFASVPSLNIYECLRDPNVPGIATLHFTWDGSRRRLVGV